MGVLHIINDLSRISGAESALLRIAGSQAVRPLAIASLGGLSSDKRIDQLPSDVEVFAVPGRLGLLGKVFSLSRLIRSRRPHSTVCWMYRSNVVGTLAWFLAGSPGVLIWNVRHSLADYQSEPLRVKISIRLNQILSRLPSKIVYASSRARDEHEKFGFFAKRSLRLPNGFEIPAATGYGRINFEGLIVGHAGRMVWEKDLRTLVAAFAIARSQSEVPMLLILAGAGYEWSNDDFVSCISSCGLSRGEVRALGPIEGMDQFYGSIDIFALSSVSEAFPNVLVEALMHGKPCVTTDVGDAAEIVDSESGWVVSPRDVLSLSDVLVRAAKMSREALAQKGLLGRLRVTKMYSIEDVSRQYDRLTSP